MIVSWLLLLWDSAAAVFTVHPYMNWQYHIFHLLKPAFTFCIISLNGFVLSNHYHWEEETLVPSSYGIGSLIKWAFIISFTHPSLLSLSVCICSQIIFLMKSSGNDVNHIRWMDWLTNSINPVNWMHIVMANCYSIIKHPSWRRWHFSEVA